MIYDWFIVRGYISSIGVRVVGFVGFDGSDRFAHRGTSVLRKTSVHNTSVYLFTSTTSLRLSIQTLQRPSQLAFATINLRISLVSSLLLIRCSQSAFD